VSGALADAKRNLQAWLDDETGVLIGEPYYVETILDELDASAAREAELLEALKGLLVSPEIMDWDTPAATAARAAIAKAEGAQ